MAKNSKAKLTKAFVENLPLAESTAERYTCWDTLLPGFGVSVGQGAKTYIVHARQRGTGKQTKHTIGRANIIGLDAARDKARNILAALQEGVNPKQQDAEARRQRRIEEITIKQVFDEYRDVRKRLKSSTADDYLDDLKLYTPEWLDAPISAITSDTILARHAKIGERSKAKADYVMRIIRALHNYYTTTYNLTTRNPVGVLSQVDGWYRVGRRRRYLTPSELGPFVASASRRNRQARDIMYCLLFAGCRVGELLELKWADIDVKSGIAYFRETKTGNPLEVPLCVQLVQLFERRAKELPGTPEDYIFFSFESESGRVTEFRGALRKIKEETGIQISPHDLRRTWLTYADEAGVGVFAQKRLVNHALPADVTQGYVQLNMERLRRDVNAVSNLILQHAELKVLPLSK